MGRHLEFTKSRQLHDTASVVIPGGVNSNVRFGEQPHPLIAEGVRISGYGSPLLSGAHDDGLIDDSLARFERAVAEFNAAK